MSGRCMPYLDGREPGEGKKVLEADISEAFKAQKTFCSREWKRLYANGTVVKWLQQGADFFLGNDAKTAIPASEYFDPTLYLSVMS